MPRSSRRKRGCINSLAKARQIKLAKKLGILSAADKIKNEPQWQGQGERPIEDEDTKPSSSQLELADLDHVMAELENETEEEESIIDDYHVEVKAEPQEDPLYIESFDDGGVLFTNVDTLGRIETTVKTTKRVTVTSTWKSTTTTAKKRMKPRIPRPPFPCILCFKNTPYDLSWLDNCTDKDFMAMFILKKMLQVPSEHLQEYLKQLKEPKRMLHVCKECKPVVIEAFGVQQEINILEKKLRSYQDDMRDQIKTTFHRWTKAKTPTTLMEKKTHWLRLQLTQNTRHFVKTGIWPPSLIKLLKGDNKVTPKKSAKARVVQQSSHPKGKQGTAEAKGGKTVAWKDCVKAFFESALNAKILNNKSNTGDACDYLQNPLSPELDCNDDSVLAKKSAKAVQQSSRSKPKRGTAEAKGMKHVTMKECVKAVFQCSFDAKVLNNKRNNNDDCDHLQNPLSPELDCNDDSVIENQCEEDPVAVDIPEETSVSLKMSVKRSCARRVSKYKCGLCPDIELLPGSQSFVEHVLYHYERPYQCSECDTFWTGNPLELENCMKGVKHNKEGLDENHRCTMGNLVKVMFKTANIWKCAHCWEKFCLETERDAHEQQVHSDKPAIDLPLSCAGCSKKLRDTDDTWRLHRILEHPHLARFSCFYCNKIFKFQTKEGIHVLDEKALSEHIATEHNQPGRTRLRRSTYHECDVCGANCSHRNELVDHFAKCHGVDKNDQLYSCRLCYKRFKEKHGLSLHFQITHCRKLPQNRPAVAKRIYPKMSVNRKYAKVYICELCPNLTIRGVQSYAEHVLYHYERPYQCSECDTFWTGNQLELEKCLEGIKHNKEGLDENHRCSAANLVKVVFKTAKIWGCAHCWEKFCLESERDAHEEQVHSDKPAIELPLSCAECSKMSRDTDDSWRLHRVLEHGHLDRLACFYCNEVFKLQTKEGIDVLDERALRNHIAAEHNRPGCERLRLDTLHGCDVCGANFRQRLQLLDHFTKCHGVGVDRNGELISCRVCYERLRDKHSLSLHFKTKHNRNRQEHTPAGEEERIGLKISVKRADASKRKIYKCELCPNLEIQGGQSFVQHVLYHYERPYQCSECDTFWTGNPLELENCLNGVKHNKEGLDENHKCTMGNLVKVVFKTAKIWECAHCWEKFCLESERDTHEEDVHSDKPAIEQPLNCDVCSKKLRDIDDSWRLHRVTEHPQQTQFACFYCNEIFKLQSKEGVDMLDEKALSEHIRTEHNTTGRTNLRLNTFSECELCGANFSHRHLLVDHFAKCHGVDKNGEFFSCRVCFKRFRDRYMLPLHFRNNHCQNRQEYICDICAYKTVNATKFTEHKLRVHDIEPEDGRKIYNCTKEDCSFRCVTKRFLQQHMIKEHGHERRYKCKFCGKGFLQASHLRIHEQGIHMNANVKSYQCEICGNSFAVRNYLYIHMRLSHQNRPFASTNRKRPSKRNKTSQGSTSSPEGQQMLRPPVQ